MKRLASLIVLVILGGCTRSIVAPESPAYVEGPVVGLFQDSSIAWVKEDPSEECGIRWWLEEAEIFERVSDGSLVRRGKDDIEVGSMVRVWFAEGAVVLDSCPGRSTAGYVELF